MRAALITAVLLALAPASAHAQAEPAPLKGEGDKFEIVGTHNIPEGSGTDLEVHGDYAYVAYFGGGFVIVDISDPKKPKRVGTLECGGGGHDIALSPDASIAYLAADDGLGDCGDGQGTAIVDVRDKTRPRVLSSLSTPEGSHTVTVDGHILSSNNYSTANVYLYDVSDPAAPKPLAKTATPGPSAFHDAFFDHRPDGKVLLYGASGEGHDIFDVTDPGKPVHLQRIVDPEVTFSHQLEPNFDRSVIIGSDEWQGGGTAGACGKTLPPGAEPVDAVPAAGAGSDFGAYAFYKAAPDGKFSTAVGEKLGTFNLPFEAGVLDGCTSHVFWQSPKENRMVAAWYIKGARIVDFSDPAKSKEDGWFIPEGANIWAAKPHRGLIFTGDLNRGMDILRYTGSGWPSNSGPAEEQRLKWHGFAKLTPPSPGAPPKPGSGTTPGQPGGSPGAPAQPRSFGRVKLRTSLKVRGKRGKKTKLTISFIDKGAAVVAQARTTKKAGRAKLRFTGVAESGAYRYVVRAGTKVLKRGRFTVKPASGVTLPAGRAMQVRAR
jgi:hypothetical protein